MSVAAGAATAPGGARSRAAGFADTCANANPVANANTHTRPAVLTGRR